MNENRSMSAGPDPGGGGGGGGGHITSQGSTLPQQPQPMSPPTRDYGATSGTGNPARYDTEGGDLNAAAPSASSSAFAYAMRPSVTSAASELFVQTTSASLRPRPPTAGGNSAASAPSGATLYVGSPPPQPGRNDVQDVELDYGQNNVPLLKAQLKVRDCLRRQILEHPLDPQVQNFMRILKLA